MTLAAPRSRQGKAFLVLAIFAAIVASVGALLWANSAQANLPTTTVTLAQSPSSPGSINPGQLVTYTMTTTTNGVNTNGAVVMTITLGSGLNTSSSSGTCPAANTGGAGITWALGGAGTGVLTCTSSAILTASMSNATMTAFANAGASGGVGTGSGSVKDADNNPVAAASNGTVGPLGTNAAATANPPTATNMVGTPHTITFTLLAGVTCLSDSFAVNPVTGNDATRNCQASDVTVTPGTTGAAVTAGPTVVGAVLAASGDVTVTIMGTTAGTATVALHLRYEGTPEICISSIQGGGCPDGGDDAALPDVTAEKIYATATGHLCHLDLPDAATEDAAGNTDGILYIGNDSDNFCQQSDIDDATGSFHAACIEDSNLTYAANGSEITWTITPVNGGPVAQSQTPFEGPNGEACVMWAAGGTGTQNISAVWNPGVVGVAPVTFFWNGTCSAGSCTLEEDTGAQQPLIKEWNTIDFTKIISSTGDVGDPIGDNTEGLADFSSRDCVDSAGICGQANLDGTTKDVTGVLFPNGGKDCPNFAGGCISANGASYIDYTMGHHNDAGGAYNGPVDGAQQTYTISGDCGSVRLENPTQGDVIILSNNNGSGTYNGGVPDNSYSSAIISSSDKGVGFQILPNSNGNLETTSGSADCQAEDCVTVTIDTEEAGLFHSPPLVTASTETITVCFHVGPPTNKQPMLAWAGQRVVLEHDWSFTDVNGNRSCPFTNNVQGNGSFLVRYVKESGNGALISDLGFGAASGPDFMVVRVSGSGDSNTDPEDNCISRVIYESQDQGEQDVVAHVVFCAPVFIPGDASVQGGPSIDPDTCSVQSEQVAFLLFYMKFEDINLTLLPDATTHDTPPSQSSTAVGAPAGAASATANVSENVLARATVRGWVLADNCPAANVAKTGSNGEALPANRCIFPDDWLFKAGGNASDERKNYDNYGGSTSGCSNVAGPYSLLDPIVFDGSVRDIVCGDSMAPHAPFGDGQRETNFPNGIIDANDAPMPSALIRFLLSGSGFLMGAEKHNSNSQFDVTHIPAEPWISPTNADLSGYQWNSWGSGTKSGVYHYWTDLADHGPEVLSCARDSSGAFVFGVGETDPCGDGSGVPTGGYDLTRVYSDEHGVAMTWINGDANLTFEDCASTVADAGHQVVLLNGFFCQSGDKVGSSTLNALADYPDKRKHFAVLSSDVTINWTWGGIKELTVQDDPNDASGQFHYVVLHVTDRDGFCGGSPSLHPVLGERVDFTIDSTTGVIFEDANGNGSAFGNTANGSKSASVTTFDADSHGLVTNTPRDPDNISVPRAGGASIAGECQAWIHVSESQQKPVNVIVTAFDPEGTVTFDTQEINPTPTPSPVPTPVPTPTPFVLHLKWGNTDCSIDGVTSRDAQGILKRVLEKTLLSQDQPCPSLGQMVVIDGNNQQWGNWDCSADGITSRDAQADLKFVLQKTALSQTAPCPAVGSDVDVEVISIP